MVAFPIAVCALLAAGSGQDTPHLQLKTSASAAAVAPGGRVTLQIDVTPKPGMHVYAPGQVGAVAIQLVLTADAAFTAAKPKYPAGEPYLMPALNETQRVYARRFRVTDDLAIKPSASGVITVKGSLRYQACDDRICYRPQTVPVEWTLTVKPRAAQAEAAGSPGSRSRRNRRPL